MVEVFLKIFFSILQPLRRRLEMVLGSFWHFFFLYKKAIFSLFFMHMVIFLDYIVKITLDVTCGTRPKV